MSDDGDIGSRDGCVCEQCKTPPPDPIAAILAVECPNVDTHEGGEVGVHCYNTFHGRTDPWFCASRIRAALTRRP